jgi:hypothetical protein
MPLQTFRYAACGGGNAILAFLVYVFLLHFVFTLDEYNLKVIMMKGYNLSLFISFTVSFFVGFVLNKYVVFTASNLRGRIQFFRYCLAYLFNVLINYLLLKFLVEYLHLNATVGQIITMVIITIISYNSQHHFTFKVKKII